MKKMILHVESRPTSPEVAEEFNRWYDEVHVPEVLALDGFVSARRYAPADRPDGAYIAHYELEGDPGEAFGRLGAAAAEGRLTMSDTMRMDPPPKMWIMELVTDQRPVSAS